MFLRSRPWLVEEFRRGERAALTQVYRSYAPALHKYVRGLARRSGYIELGQVSAVSDVVQEVFARAFSPASRRAYNATHEYGPYLKRIARNCFIDAARQRNRELLKPPEQVILELDDRTRLQPDWTEPDLGIRCALTAYIESLPQALKGVYERRFVIGQSQGQTGEVLGLSRAQIRTGERQLRRGLRRALLGAGLGHHELARPPKRVMPAAAHRNSCRL
jgi:RNA polymerase sigma factor (sigma-70 family)